MNRTVDHADSTPWGLIGWALYDWANSSFPTVVQTFVFAAYFTSRVAENKISGSEAWGNTLGLAGIAVAVLGPLLGATVDRGGRRKGWIGVLTLICCVATAGLWFVTPSSSSAGFALVLVGIGTVGFELACVLYNAMLPSLSGSERLGRWSGWGWALGYGGGLSCLAVVLVAFVYGEGGWLGLNAESFQHVRIAFPFVAGWYLVFSLPFFLWTPEDPPAREPVYESVTEGLRQLGHIVSHLRKRSSILLFLVARLLYVDGLATVFAFGGVYAAGTFNMGETTVLLFGITLNVTAGLGAAGFSWVDDALGSKPTILASLLGLLVSGTLILLVQSSMGFWIAGSVLGVFVGPVQSASRSLLARLAPSDLRNEMFGLYAFSGKATAFMGPFLVGWITAATQSQRLGMSTTLVFFLVGGLLLLGVPEPGSSRSPSST